MIDEPLDGAADTPLTSTGRYTTAKSTAMLVFDGAGAAKAPASPGFGYAMHIDSLPQDCYVEAGFLITDPANNWNPRIYGRCDAAKTHYGYGGTTGKNFTLVQRDASFAASDGTPQTLSVGEHVLRVEIEGATPTVRVLVDGALKTTWTEPGVVLAGDRSVIYLGYAPDRLTYHRAGALNGGNGGGGDGEGDFRSPENFRIGDPWLETTVP